MIPPDLPPPVTVDPTSVILVVWGIRVALRLIGQPLARLPVALGTFIVSTVIVIARWQAVFEPPEPPRTLEDMKYLRDGLEVFVMTPDMIVNYSYAAAACLLTSWTIRREWVALSLDASVLGLVLPCTVLMGNRYTSAGVFALTVVFVVQVLLLAHASARDRRPAGARGGAPYRDALDETAHVEPRVLRLIPCLFGWPRMSVGPGRPAIGWADRDRRELPP